MHLKILTPYSSTGFVNILSKTQLIFAIFIAALFIYGPLEISSYGLDLLLACPMSLSKIFPNSF